MYKNILSFEISMINILFVKVLTAINQLNNERNGFFFRKGSFLSKNAFQISILKKSLPTRAIL